MWKIYLDACVLNRPSDHQSQERVYLEAQAVERLIGLLHAGRLTWVASRALEVELLNNPNPEKRRDALELFAHAAFVVAPSAGIRERGVALGEAGYGAYDALHLAFAEDANVDVLLTTDDRFIRQAARGSGGPLTRVLNPVDWLEEIHHGSD